MDHSQICFMYKKKVVRDNFSNGLERVRGKAMGVPLPPLSEENKYVGKMQLYQMKLHYDIRKQTYHAIYLIPVHLYNQNGSQYYISTHKCRSPLNTNNNPYISANSTRIYFG